SVRERARTLADAFPGLAGMLTKMGEGIAVDGMESLTPALVDRVLPLIDFLPEGAATAVIDPERAVTRASTLGETNREFLEAAWNAATAGADAPIDTTALLSAGLAGGDFLTLPALREAAHERTGVWWTF